MSERESLCLMDLADPGEMTERLSHRGLSVPAAGDKADLFAEIAQGLIEGGHDDHAPLWAFYVPGRIEVLGKHTDYAGGSSVLAAAERGFCLAGVARRTPGVRIYDAVYDDETEFAISPDLAPQPGHWSNYCLTVARRLARNFAGAGALRGADIVLASDLPPAAGMSSSSAMMVALFHVLSAVNNLPARAEYQAAIDSPAVLAEYLGTIENGQTFKTLAGDKGVGTFGGSEDHTAMLCCSPGELAQYAYCPVRHERDLPVPEGHTFAIAVSGVVAEKTGAAMEQYNRASRLAAEAARLWREATRRDDPHLAAAMASSDDAAEVMRKILTAAPASEFAPADLLRRFEAFYRENYEIIPAAGEALRNADVDTFGLQVDRSQEATRDLLCNQVDETVFLAAAARDLGAAAASAFGAGFGGSVWALVEEDGAEDFLTHWAESYLHAYPDAGEDAGFFLTDAGPAAFEIR